MKSKTNKFIKSIMLSLTSSWLITFSSLTQTQKADLVIFSYNRPIQLYALLESINLYTTGIGQTHVIYRTTDSDYGKGYQEVQQAFPHAIFHKQSQNPHLDFKPLTLKASFESPSKYIIFAVDDIIVKDHIDISKSIDLLEQTNAYGFYFRLGLNIDYCYYLNVPNPAPKLSNVCEDVYKWQTKNGTCDWGFPNTVDMTIYRKKDIEHQIRTLNYNTPNTLEGGWCCCDDMTQTRNKFVLCYKESKIINVPLNIVQTSYLASRNMNIDPKVLLDLFNQGLKIDILQLHKIKNRSVHMEFMPTFIKR